VYETPKMFNKAPMQSLNKTINESFEDTLEGSVAEETKFILKRYGYGDSTLILEPRESIRTFLDFDKKEEPVKITRSKSIRSRQSFSSSRI